MKARAVLLILALPAGPGIGTYASAQDLAKGLVGVWRLVSTEQRMNDGTSRPSPRFGPNGLGYLIYSQSGRMCAVLADPNRDRWKSDESPTAIELQSSFEHFAAYCGRYEVSEEHGYVIHHVELDVVPNSVGTDLKRYVSLEGNRLKLRPAEPLAKGVLEYTLTWERVDDSDTGSNKR